MPLISVVETPSYLADAEKTLSQTERDAVIDMLAENPRLGVIIKGSGGLRKLRIGMDGRGKRGGGRVIYWFHSEGCPVVLLAMFAKNEASDLTAKERAVLAKVAEHLLQDFKRKLQ